MSFTEDSLADSTSGYGHY